MSRDIERITSPDGAKDTFILLMDEFYKISNPIPGYRTGSTITVWNIIGQLPAPSEHTDVFEYWRDESRASLRRLEGITNAKKFKEAKREFLEKVRGMLDTYLDAQQQ